jgi:hypothetical protein
MIDPFEPSSDFLDALSRRGILFRRNVSKPSEITICCLFCGDSRFRLGINFAKNVGHCFNCSWKSREVLEDISEALTLGVLHAGQDDLGLGEVEKRSIPRPSLPEDFVLLSEPPSDSLARRALNYLLNRKVEPWQIKRKKIGVSFIGRYAYRIVFPVYHGRELKGLVARDFTDMQEPKYLNSAGARAIYGVRVEKKCRAVLCEGIFDCLALERALPTEDYDVLALLGHTISELQQEQLTGYEEIVLWPDADVPGVKGFLDIAKQLALRHKLFVVPPNKVAKDAGDTPTDVLLQQWGRRTKLTGGLDLRLRVAAVFQD